MLFSCTILYNLDSNHLVPEMYMDMGEHCCQPKTNFDLSNLQKSGSAGEVNLAGHKNWNRIYNGVRCIAIYSKF